MTTIPAIGTVGTFHNVKCIIAAHNSNYSPAKILLEFLEDPGSVPYWAGWGNNPPGNDPNKKYWWDSMSEFVAISAEKVAEEPWFLGLRKITRATYKGIPCKILPNHGFGSVMEFEKEPTTISFWKGTQKEPKDPQGILPDRFYQYITAENVEFLVLEGHHGYNCCECNTRNEYAEANLSESRFICWGCADIWRWKYTDDFLPGHRFYKAPKD
jgi:hypothetical protein